MKLWVEWERSLLLDLTVPFLQAQNFISFSKLVFYVLCTLYLRERKTDFPSNNANFATPLDWFICYNFVSNACEWLGTSPQRIY